MSMYLTIFGKPRYLGLAVMAEGESLSAGEPVLIESSRGVEVAQVAGEISESQEAVYRSIDKDNHQEGPVSSDSGLQSVTFLAKATLEHMVQEEQNRKEEEQALVLSRQILSHHNLDMKLVDVEFLNDRKKLFLYFTSAQRVDFRAYVRDLAREFRTRIELRQIGARDEAKVARGLGPCGKPCCCSYWLQRFLPIGIRMVKEQNLALNPSKISGLCGRLMCCMSFEQHSYRELWSTLPSQGSKIRAEQGTYVLLGVDLASRTCQISGPEGTHQIPVELFGAFKETVFAGKSWDNEAYGLDEKGKPLSQKPCCSARFCDGNCGSCSSGCAMSAAHQGPPCSEEILGAVGEGLEELKDIGKGPHRRKKKGPSRQGEPIEAAQRPPQGASDRFGDDRPSPPRGRRDDKERRRENGGESQPEPRKAKKAERASRPHRDTKLEKPKPEKREEPSARPQGGAEGKGSRAPRYRRQPRKSEQKNQPLAQEG